MYEGVATELRSNKWSVFEATSKSELPLADPKEHGDLKPHQRYVAVSSIKYNIMCFPNLSAQDLVYSKRLLQQEGKDHNRSGGAKTGEANSDLTNDNSGSFFDDELELAIQISITSAHVDQSRAQQ